MSATLALSARLAGARLRDPRGTGALDVFAVRAHGVTAWLSFVVASGTWMFVQRREHVPAWLLGLTDPEASKVGSSTTCPGNGPLRTSVTSPGHSASPSLSSPLCQPSAFGSRITVPGRNTPGRTQGNREPIAGLG